MRRRLVTILATTLLASGIAAAQEPTSSPAEVVPVEAPSVFAGVTLSCSLAAPSWVAGCWVERPVLVFGSLEVAVGIDAQGDLGALLTGELDGSHIAPYGVLAWYGEDTSFWLELRLPRLGNVPLIGAADALRVGFSTRFE